jgi:hypothetical protein
MNFVDIEAFIAVAERKSIANPQGDDAHTAFPIHLSWDHLGTRTPCFMDLFGRLSTQGQQNHQGFW